VKSPYLRRPRIEAFQDSRGRFEGAHVRLQRAGLKAHCCITPNPEILFDVGIDRAGLPVFLSMDDPVDATTLVRTIRMFLEGCSGMTGGGPPVKRPRPAPDPATVGILLRAAEMLAPRLDGWAESWKGFRAVPA